MTHFYFNEYSTVVEWRINLILTSLRHIFIPAANSSPCNATCWRCKMCNIYAVRGSTRPSAFVAIVLKTEVTLNERMRIGSKRLMVKEPSPRSFLLAWCISWCGVKQSHVFQLQLRRAPNTGRLGMYFHGNAPVNLK